LPVYHHTAARNSATVTVCVCACAPVVHAAPRQRYRDKTARHADCDKTPASSTAAQTKRVLSTMLPRKTDTYAAHTGTQRYSRARMPAAAFPGSFTRTSFARPTRTRAAVRHCTHATTHALRWFLHKTLRFLWPSSERQQAGEGSLPRASRLPLSFIAYVNNTRRAARRGVYSLLSATFTLQAWLPRPATTLCFNALIRILRDSLHRLKNRPHCWRTI